MKTTLILAALFLSSNLIARTARSGYTLTLAPGSLTGNRVITFPNSDGAITALPSQTGHANQFLKADGSGNLSWNNAGGIAALYRKTADESVNNGTLQDDDHLTNITIAANKCMKLTDIGIFFRQADRILRCR